MITVILPAEEVQSLGNVVSKFLYEDGENLIDEVFDVAYADLLVGGVPFENLLEAKDAMRENVLDMIVIVCLDNLIDALGTEGYNSTVINIVNGIVENDLTCRAIHVDTLLSSDFSFALDNSMAHYDIYSAIQRYIASHLTEEESYAEFRTALIETITNLNAYGDLNMRDVLSTTIVDKRSLVLFMRNYYEGEGM